MVRIRAIMPKADYNNDRFRGRAAWAPATTEEMAMFQGQDARKAIVWREELAIDGPRIPAPW